jgi:hypothetical protein
MRARAPSAWGAWRFLTAWVRALRWQRLPAFDKVAQLLSRHLAGILAYCHVKVPFGKVEAINGNIRAMIRRGRGYRDHEYLLLKVQMPNGVLRDEPHESWSGYRFRCRALFRGHPSGREPSRA